MPGWAGAGKEVFKEYAKYKAANFGIGGDQVARSLQPFGENAVVGALAAQLTHVAALVAPLAALKRPGLHCAHAVELLPPLTVPYEPPAHGTHVETPLTALKVPALQSTQAVELLAPVVEPYEPTPHGVQAVAPEEMLYEPA